MKLFLLFSLCVISLHAESRGHKIYHWSVATFTIGNGMDAVSSFGPGRETNPVLARNGQFTSESVGLKFGIQGAIIGAQYLIMRKHPELEKPFAVMNYGVGGYLGGVAISNFKKR